VATGWYTQREELWKVSRPVSEWMARRLAPQPGDTVLELAAGLDDTGLMAARLVGETGRVISRISPPRWSPQPVGGHKSWA
jgi:hypothetical protein